MIHIYGIKNCGSVKKALQFFDAHRLPYTFHDFKTSPVSYDTVHSWAEKCDPSSLLNTKGTTYRTLNLKSLLLDNRAKIEWMSNHNLLIKRPVIECDGELTVGFDQTQYEGKFLS